MLKMPARILYPVVQPALTRLISPLSWASHGEFRLAFSVL